MLTTLRIDAGVDEFTFKLLTPGPRQPGLLMQEVRPRPRLCAIASPGERRPRE